MYRKKYQSWRKHFDFLLLDIVCLQITYVISFFMLFGFNNPYGNSIYRNFIIVVTIIDAVVLVLYETLKNVLHRGYYKELIKTAKHCCIVSIMTIFYMYMIQDMEYNRYFLIAMLVIYLSLSYITRCVWKFVLRKMPLYTGKRGLLIITTSSMLPSIMKKLNNREFANYKIVGASIIDQDLKGQHIDGIKIVANSDDIDEFVCRNWVDEVFIRLGDKDPFPEFLVDKFEEMGVVTHITLFDGSSTPGRKQFVEHLDKYTVLTTTINYASTGKLMIKRLIDIFVGIIGCVLTGLIALVVAPIIYIKSPGPIFFKQERVGENGKTFKMYKFRSMYLDAEERKKDLQDQNLIEDGLMFKMEDDPRVIGYKKLPDGTVKKGIGHFLRSTSLDEFPQFLNILKGNMSLVGTRPPTVEEWQKYKFRHRARLSVKPGLTGLWQISGRSEITDFEEVVRLDTEYIQTWSIGNDIKIILKTLMAVLKRKGSM